MITDFDWKAAESKGGAVLTQDEKRILALLAEGKSTPAIAKILGVNRSAIWFKALKIRKKITERAD